jgi:uncharacterized membrane protein YbhN (UPF0104 family)
MQESLTTDPTADALGRFRKWLAIFVALASLGYVGFAVWSGLRQTASALYGFPWLWYLPVLALTLVNYGMRYYKWSWLLRQLGVDVPVRGNVGAFVAGLAMVITPGKAGELLKPYLIQVMVGAPLERTVPALVAERGTDGIAIVVLAALGVRLFLPERANLIYATLAVLALGLVALAIEPLAMAVLGVIRGWSPGLGDRMIEFYRSLRLCLRPWAFFVTMSTSMVAWTAECVGYWIILRGLGADCGLGAPTFIYAFATVFGAWAPGGLGAADGALVTVSQLAIPGMSAAAATAGALLVRIATLWFGVLLGAGALLGLDAIIAAGKRRG